MAKHAEATKIEVTLRRDSKTVSLSVEDDGHGFVFASVDEDHAGNGAGLQGMVERLEMVDGELEINAARGQGSCLTATVPFSEEEE